MASLLNIKYTKSKSVKDPMFRKGDNGIDLFIPDDFFFDNKYILKPNEFIIIDSGIAFELPENYFLISATRSSNCLRGLVSTCTVVDSMYRGNVHLQVHNISNDSIMICNGDKLVQFVLLWQPYFKLEKVKKINTKTIRATKKFGSTGNK